VQSIEDQIIFITGSAKRVGFEIAKLAAQEGATIVLHYRSSREEAEDALQKIKDLSPRSIVIQGDQTKKEDIKRMVSEIENHFGSLDVIVNSASVFPEAKFHETSEDDYDHIMGANLRGPYFLTQACLPLLEKSESPQIVNIVDAMNDRPSANYSAYFASKAGLESLTLSWAKELAPKFRVNAIAPGPVLEPENHSDERRDNILKRLPLDRWGTPETIAEAVLAVLQNDFMTGSIVKVDGGRSIG